ncbi:MAG: crossover junction endodeoxyribonuclease RuvC [Parcubacteria group bacterium]|jgi:Holliday junction resolvasome RuvABC endonuclease subunit
MAVRLLGIDTGWVATGFALVDWCCGTPTTIQAARTCHTEPTPKQRRESEVIDHQRRMGEISRATDSALADFHPDMVVVEALSLGAPNVRSLVVQALGYAAVMCSCIRAGVAVRQVAPADVRRALDVQPRKGWTQEQKKAAVKAAVLRYVLAPSCATEHEWDAAAAALACLVPTPLDLVLAVQAGRAAS